MIARSISGGGGCREGRAPCASGWIAGAWKQSSAGRTYFLYDGIQPVCELNSSGAVVATNTFGAAGLVSRNVSGTSTFYTFDPQGGVSQRLDSNGNVLANYMFDAFGSRSGTDSSTDPFTGFGGASGYYTDWETGLQSMAFRYYDSAAGRFLNRDPIGYAGGINVYSYTGNDPTGFADPSGLQEEEVEFPGAGSEEDGYECDENGRRYFTFPGDPGFPKYVAPDPEPSDPMPNPPSWPKQWKLPIFGGDPMPPGGGYVAGPTPDLPPVWVPGGWIPRPTNSGEGIIWEDPDPDSGASIRIMPPRFAGPYPYPKGYIVVTDPDTGLPYDPISGGEPKGRGDWHLPGDFGGPITWPWERRR